MIIGALLGAPEPGGGGHVRGEPSPRVEAGPQFSGTCRRHDMLTAAGGARMPGSAAPVSTAFSVVCLKVDESFRSPPNRNQTFISMINHFGMTLKSGVVETGHGRGSLANLAREEAQKHSRPPPAQPPPSGHPGPRRGRHQPSVAHPAECLAAKRSDGLIFLRVQLSQNENNQ